MAERLIELRVRNHPGVMSHVTGLFARRAFNIERILCLPDAAGATSRILLSVREPARIDQVLRQAERLHDVLEAREAAADPEALFESVAAVLGEAGLSSGCDPR